MDWNGISLNIRCQGRKQAVGIEKGNTYGVVQSRVRVGMGQYDTFQIRDRNGGATPDS